MGQARDDEDPVDLWRLTPGQRQQVYEEEKARIEKAAPLFSKTTKVVVAVYFLGCLLGYFGVTKAVVLFWSTRTWKLEPQPDVFTSLIEAAITLVGPLLAVVMTFWAVAIPAFVVVGFWFWGADIVRFFVRLRSRDGEED